MERIEYKVIVINIPSVTSFLKCIEKKMLFLGSQEFQGFFSGCVAKILYGKTMFYRKVKANLQVEENKLKTDILTALVISHLLFCYLLELMLYGVLASFDYLPYQQKKSSFPKYILWCTWPAGHAMS